MAEYQNLFTRVHVTAPPDPGPEIDQSLYERGGTVMSYWANKIGDAQIGPFYLGGFGLLSVICGFIAFEIIGFNMLASVDYDWVEFY
ncbi:MAG: photosynthetic reaction center subunit M, partial [Pseudomonadota bacterium]